MSSCFLLLVTVLILLKSLEASEIDKSIEEIVQYSEDVDISIQYLLYTPDTPEQPCFLEPNPDALERCPFNSSYPMKILIFGFHEELSPDSAFILMKNKFLALYEYNVIIVNWKCCNQPPVILAAVNTQLVGYDLSQLIKFLEVNTGLDPENVHIIGQSYGAQVAGAAGRNTPNLGRITGLDPGAPLFSPIPIFTPLGYNDANFVDVIHTSNLKYGFGIYDPIGDVNFYPNGGARQPQCDPSNNKSQSYELMLRYRNCNHQSAPNFFLQSINTTECLFWSVHCDSYDDFLGGQCPPGSSLVNLMGLPAKKIPGLSPKSKFYLRTGVQFPYCLKNGYEPA